MFNIFAKKPAAGKQIKFKISGMHCSSCSLNIDDTLEDLPGVIEASTNYARSESTIQFDPTKVKQSALQKAIEELGYTISDTYR
jgi:copper chaperone CopZ